MAGAVEKIAAMLRDLRAEAVAVAQKQEEAFQQAFDTEAEAAKLPVQRLLDFVDANLADDLPDVRGLRQLRQEAKRMIRDALDRVYFHLVTSILASESSDERQRLRFKEFGFQLTPSAAPLQESNALGTLIALVLIAVLLPSGIYWGVSELGSLNNEALKMSCGNLVLTAAWEPAVWSVIAVAQNVVAVVVAYLLYALLDRYEQASTTLCAGKPEPLNFTTFTRRTVAFLNAASLAFFVNLLLLAALTALDPAGSCRIVHTWTWAILPGMAGGFAAVYLRMSSRGFSAYQWPLWQSFLTGSAAVLIALSVLHEQSRAGATGIDLPWALFLLAPLGFAYGLNARMHCLEPALRRRRLWLAMTGLGCFALLFAAVGLGSLEPAAEGPPPPAWLQGVPVSRSWLVVPAGFVLALVAGSMLGLGYRILLLWKSKPGTKEQAEEQGCGDRAAQAQGRPLFVSTLAILTSVLYGFAIFLLALWSLDLLGQQGTAKTQTAELSFLLYAYAAASTVALLSGFFVIKFRESGAMCGKGMEPFMNDESFEVVLKTRGGKEGGLGVVPVGAWRAMVISVPGRFELQDASVRLPNGERRRAEFKVSLPDEPDETDEANGCGAATAASPHRRIWMELDPK